MADHDDRKEWGVPGVNKDMLNEYWTELLEKTKKNKREEIIYFYHCTSIKAKADIVENGIIVGFHSDLPALSPLASYKGLSGTWFALSSADLPNKSPYGTQRALFRVNDFMTYLCTEVKEPEVYDHENRWDASEDDENTCRSKSKAGAKKAKKKTSRGKKDRPVNKKQKDCYLKHKIPPPEKEVVLMDPQLFFECAYYYGTTQYVRLVLVRSADPLATWCEEMCKEIDLSDNPFLQYEDGRIWTHRRGGPTRQTDVVVDMLVVGDTDITQMPKRPEWDKVSNMRRTGFDPELGARRGILNDGVMYGSYTDLPSSAPLASNIELTGTWFSLSSDTLPRKSPYGTQRMMFRANEFMSYLMTNIETPETNDSVDGIDEPKMSKNSEVIQEPMLFFECAHHYGNKQYVRVLLVRTSDPMVGWCKNTCKEINLRDNPFLEYSSGRIWSQARGQRAQVTVDVLVVGDIYLDQMPQEPEWNKVGKATRAGGNPVLGLC